MRKNRPVDKLYKTIARATKKLEEIREKCKHGKTRPENYSWRPGAFSVENLCTKCDKVIPRKLPSFSAGGSNSISITKNDFQ